jgi:hypothetical protein
LKPVALSSYGSTAFESYSPPPAGSAPPSSAEASSPWAARARSQPQGSGTEWFTHRTVYTQNGLHTEWFTHLVQQLVQPRLLALVDLALQAAGGARAAEEHRGAAVDGLVDAERLGSLSWCLVGKEGKGEVAGSSLVSGGTR